MQMCATHATTKRAALGGTVFRMLEPRSRSLERFGCPDSLALLTTMHCCAFFLPPNPQTGGAVQAQPGRKVLRYGAYYSRGHLRRDPRHALLHLVE